MFGFKAACGRWFARQAREQREIVVNRTEQIESLMNKRYDELQAQVTALKWRVAKLEQEKGD